jgi:hypothetical protein
MECNHRINDARLAMEELENALAAKEEEPQPGHVPCDGCTLCCRGDAIRLLPSDDASKYQTVAHQHFQGQLMLAHKPNHECIYLADYGCIIQGDKPQMCREMDCRQLAMKIRKKDLKRYGIPLRIWERGRRMIGKIV